MEPGLYNVSQLLLLYYHINLMGDQRFWACRTPWMMPTDPEKRRQANKAKAQLGTEAGVFSDHLALVRVNPSTTLPKILVQVPSMGLYSPYAWFWWLRVCKTASKDTCYFHLPDHSFQTQTWGDLQSLHKSEMAAKVFYACQRPSCLQAFDNWSAAGTPSRQFRYSADLQLNNATLRMIDGFRRQILSELMVCWLTDCSFKCAILSTSSSLQSLSGQAVPPASLH